MDPELIRRTGEIADEYLASLAERPVGAEASLEELRSALGMECNWRTTEDDIRRSARAILDQLAASAPASA